MALTAINEGTTCYLTVTFKDKAGVSSAPTSATWQAIDLGTGNELQAATALSVAASVEITIPASVNNVVNEDNPVETRRVIIKASYGSDDKLNGSYDYQVKNLSKV